VTDVAIAPVVAAVEAVLGVLVVAVEIVELEAVVQVVVEDTANTAVEAVTPHVEGMDAWMTEPKPGGPWWSMTLPTVGPQREVETRASRYAGVDAEVAVGAQEQAEQEGR
jgi:hypothetical protein